MTPADRDARPTVTRVTLLVAGDTGMSAAAKANLAAIMVDQPAAGVDASIIDVLEEPDFALRYRAFFTPTLILETATRLTRVVGDLRDSQAVRLLLAAPAD